VRPQSTNADILPFRKIPRLCGVGIPDDEFLKLKAEYPEGGFKGHNPNLDVAIKGAITKEETERIARHLNIPYDTKLKLQTRRGIPRPVDEAKPVFESNGKKFWIFRQQS
jgi:hypothetical protein